MSISPDSSLQLIVFSALWYTDDDNLSWSVLAGAAFPAIGCQLS
jgi:hypothetical protein